MKSNFVVSTEWLASNLNQEKLVVLDASMKPVTASEDNDNSLIIMHAIKFDIKNKLSDSTSPYSHMLLPRDTFVQEMQLLGISDDSIIVIYDSIGLYSSPRAWYMLKEFGHENVFVLDGGLPAWIDGDFPMVAEYSQPERQGDFSDRGGEKFFCDANDVLEYMNDDRAKIIDARSSGRFNSLEPEPRSSLKSGHIPRAINLPFKNVLSNGKFKSIDNLQLIFSSLDMNEDSFVFSCGSGVTSCITSMAAQIVGYSKVIIYDGSWTEWADENNEFPIERTQE